MTGLIDRSFINCRIGFRFLAPEGSLVQIGHWRNTNRIVISIKHPGNSSDKYFFVLSVEASPDTYRKALKELEMGVEDGRYRPNEYELKRPHEYAHFIEQITRAYVADIAHDSFAKEILEMTYRQQSDDWVSPIFAGSYSRVLAKDDYRQAFISEGRAPCHSISLVSRGPLVAVAHFLYDWKDSQDFLDPDATVNEEFVDCAIIAATLSPLGN